MHRVVDLLVGGGCCTYTQITLHLSIGCCWWCVAAYQEPGPNASVQFTWMSRPPAFQQFKFAVVECLCYSLMMRLRKCEVGTSLPTTCSLTNFTQMHSALSAG